jgi:hypothetical protein
MTDESAASAYLRAALTLYEHTISQGFTSPQSASKGSVSIPFATWRAFEALTAACGDLPEEFAALQIVIASLRDTATPTRPTVEFFQPYHQRSLHSHLPGRLSSVLCLLPSHRR